MECTKTKSKTRSKNRLFICFKPTVMDCDSSTDPVLANFPVGEKESSVVLPRMLSSSSAPKVMADCGEEESGRPSKKNRYWLILKTALKYTSLGKKIRRKAAKHKSFQSSSISNSSYKATSSSSSSSFCSSASASSSLLSPSSSSLSSNTFGSSSSFEMKRINATELSKRRQQTQDSVKESKHKCYDSKMQMCWFLVSLLVLILWGKLYSILCTCVWLYLVPRRSSQGGRHATGETEFESVRCNKKGA